MANSYTQIYIHYVFTVKGRENFLPSQHNEELHKYIRVIVEKRKSILVAINNIPDHVHILISLNPNQSISKLIQEIKSISSNIYSQLLPLSVDFHMPPVAAPR